MAQLRALIQGQDAALHQLKKMRAQKRPASGLLLAGPPGVGKTLAAWSYMQDVLCTEAGEIACGRCGSCKKVATKSHESILRISTEGASLKLDSLARLPSFLSLRSTSAWQFVILEEAEKLNPQASNVLLKSLEEPPEGTSFILVSSQATRLLPTLLSRCQILRFKALSGETLRALRPEAPEWALRASQGRMDLLDQWLSSDAEEIRGQMADLFRRWWDTEDLSVKEFEAYVKDRALMVQLLEFWQQLVRETVSPSAPSETPRPFVLFEALQRSLEDLASNVDRSLIVENLIYAAQSGDHPQLVL